MTSSLTDLYNASQTWTKCISRDQKHIDCILKSKNTHDRECAGANHISNPTGLT
jgi:hypothetical protein